MKKINSLFKLISFLLILALLVQPAYNVHADNDTEKIYNNKNNYGTLVDSTDDYNVYYEEKSNFYYIMPKKVLSNELLKAIQDKYSTIGKEKGIGTISLAVAIDVAYFKPDRDAKNKIDALHNGWLNVEIDSKDIWVYKEKGEMYNGWLKYNGSWYYIDNGFMFDPKYNKSSWRLINKKWYDFNIGGKLKELECWQNYSNHKMYHIPNDFGALTDSKAQLGSTWYQFDSNGYCIDFIY